MELYLKRKCMFHSRSYSYGIKSDLRHLFLPCFLRHTSRLLDSAYTQFMRSRIHLDIYSTNVLNDSIVRVCVDTCCGSEWVCPCMVRLLVVFILIRNKCFVSVQDDNSNFICKYTFNTKVKMSLATQ
jgi:hypothetical protein